MSVMASQSTSVSIVCITVCSGTDQRYIKVPCHWSLWGNSPVTGEFSTQRWKMLSFDDVIMTLKECKSFKCILKEDSNLIKFYRIPSLVTNGATDVLNTPFLQKANCSWTSSSIGVESFSIWDQIGLWSMTHNNHANHPLQSALGTLKFGTSREKLIHYQWFFPTEIFTKNSPKTLLCWFDNAWESCPYKFSCMPW